MSEETRQAREREFHRDYARQHAAKIEEPVDDDVVRATIRRPWNAYWCAYDALRGLGLAGKRVLVPGCGFGEDAIRLCWLGAEVDAFDLSEDLLEIARARAARAGLTNVRFAAMPAEALTYPDGRFDVIFFNDILHHVDIPRALAEARRVLKPDGVLVVNELYTHSWLQKLRESRLVARIAHPRLTRFIYGTDKPYITEDERKVNEAELDSIAAQAPGGTRTAFFLLFGGRLFPAWWPRLGALDHALLSHLGPLQRFLAGRFVLVGRAGI